LIFVGLGFFGGLGHYFLQRAFELAPAPFVSPFMAGATLVGFSGALLHMYQETPGMTEEDGVRPTSKGVPLAKDVWMLGIGLGLMIDGLTPKRKRRKPARTAATPRR